MPALGASTSNSTQGTGPLQDWSSPTQSSSLGRMSACGTKRPLSIKRPVAGLGRLRTVAPQRGSVHSRPVSRPSPPGRRQPSIGQEGPGGALTTDALRRSIQSTAHLFRRNGIANIRRTPGFAAGMSGVNIRRRAEAAYRIWIRTVLPASGERNNRIAQSPYSAGSTLHIPRPPRLTLLPMTKPGVVSFDRTMRRLSSAI